MGVWTQQPPTLRLKTSFTLKVLKYQDIHKVFAGLIERVSLCDNFCFPIVDDNVVK